MPNTVVTQEVFSSLPQGTRAGVVVPLFGFWADAPTEQMTAEVLQLALSRLKSKEAKLYFVFVCELARLPQDVATLLTAYQAAGNSIIIEPKPPTYASYAF